MALPFKFHLGHTLILIDDYGREAKYYVREIKADGWMLEPYEQEGARHLHSGAAVRRYYLAGRMRYLPWDDDAIPAARRRRLREAFVAQSKQQRLIAVRRRAIVRACEDAIAGGMGKGAALRDVPEQVVSARGREWHREDIELSKKIFDERKDKGLLGDGEYFKDPDSLWLKAPCARTVWGWMCRYVEGGRNINSLLDNHADKGRRESQLTPHQDRVLATFFKDHVRAGRGFEIGAAYKALNDILGDENMISRKTFKQRLQREFDKKGIAQAKIGRRAARRVGETSSRGITPLFPLHQVEADHTLLNIKVVDDETGVDLGRPWLTVIKDRLTFCPTGLHLSFLAPSWATLSRCLAQSMWPKDLSEHPGIRNSWSAEGIFDEAYTDRGMDFIGKAGRWAGAEMNFEILNLPGYSPWLKGSLERWNRDVKAEIMTYRDGITSFEDPEYRGKNLPTVRLSELKSGLLEWLVDDFLSEGHSSLEDQPPNEAWREAVERHGPTRPVQDFDKFRRMTMIPDKRTIQNRGVEVGGFFYRDEFGELSEIRRRHDAPREFLILIDPWDTGYIEILVGKRWLVLLNECTELDGISNYKSEFYWDQAASTHPGKRLTIDDFLRAREIVDADAMRVLALGPKINKRGSQNLLGRFLDLGKFMTPVPLRPVRFRPAPIELPGLVESGGIIRPAWRPQPTPALILPRSESRVGTADSVPGPAAPHDAEFFNGEDRTGHNAPRTTDLFARLAADAAARSRELGAKGG